MIVQNRHLHTLTWFIHLVSTIIFVLLVFSIYLTRFYEHLTPNLSRDYYTVFFSIIYIVVLFYPNILKYHYIYYSDEGDNLVFKIYPIGFFTSKKLTYHIPKRDFIKAEIRQSFFRLRTTLIIFQKVGKRAAKYPPIYLNGMPKEDRRKILLSLSRLMAEVASVSKQG